jgi:hypothetical protein
MLFAKKTPELSWNGCRNSLSSRSIVVHGFRKGEGTTRCTSSTSSQPLTENKTSPYRHRTSTRVVSQLTGWPLALPRTRLITTCSESACLYWLQWETQMTSNFIGTYDRPTWRWWLTTNTRIFWRYESSNIST